MFTRNELLILGFMVVFAVAGTLINTVRGRPAPAAITVQHSAFAVARPDSVSDTLAPVPAPESRKTLKSECVKININQAGLDDLMRVKGIGESTARRILEYRDKNNGFKSVEELLNIKGIGKKRLEKMAVYLGT